MSSRPGTRPSFGSILAGLVAVLALAGLLYLLVRNGPEIVRSFFPPDPVTTQARQINDLYTIVFVIAAAIFFLVEALIVWSVIRYRRRPGDTELPPQTHGHNLAEIVWTVVPTIIVIFLFFISWQTLNTVEATAPQPDLRVKAVAGQFQWTFDYLPSDGGADSKPLFSVTAPIGPDGGLVLPAGKTTHLYLSSPDVIHAFYVPEFLFKRDVVPGIVNEFDLTIEADQANQTFRGQCAELCGVGHRIMVFEVHAVDPAKFQAWYDGKLAAASATPTPVPSGGGGPVVDLVAKGVKFDKAEITAKPDAPFTIHFDNQDAGTPHDVDILDGSGAKVFEGQDFPGPGVRDYGVQPLPAGDYQFICSIHPTLMFGTLKVQ
jgi:cytochrome c oxidase subunit II